MSDPTPVPLDEIERQVPLGWHFDPLTVAALTKALRIAVEGLEECGRYERPAVPRGYTHVDALAAVRELVDLGGEKP